MQYPRNRCYDDDDDDDDGNENMIMGIFITMMIF